jgi:hypothetical protein
VRRNAHKGETILILGSGPSLNDFNVNDLQRFTTIGANQISRRVDPTYVTLFDDPTGMGEGIPYVMRSLEKGPCIINEMFDYEWTNLLPPQFRDKLRLTKIGWKPAHKWLNWNRKDYIPVIKEWDLIVDGAECETLPFGPTSIGTACWLAAYMGAARVGLIGVDLGDDYFFPSVKPFATNPVVARAATTHWGQLVRMLEMLTPTRIFNLSERSKVDTLTRATLADWLKEMDA